MAAKVADYSSLNHWDMFSRRWLAIALVLYLLAAIFSLGIIHYDEQFQVLEFASYKMGITEASQLPWEFPEQVRPWLQPIIFIGLFDVLKFFGVTNPYDLVLGARVFVAIMGWLSVCLFAKAIPLLTPNPAKRRWMLRALVLFYSLPMLHARTSSDNFATSFLVAAVALVLIAIGSKTTTQRAWAVIGLCFGLSFTMRFQNPMMILGASFWLLMIARVPIKSLAIMVAAGVAMVALGLVVDRWGYGVWTSSPWNYFHDVILEDRHSTFGVSPWWWYLMKMFQERPPLGALLLIGCLWTIGKQPRHLFTWMILPFLLLNSVIGHKEFRFMMPYFYFAPVMALVAIPDRWWDVDGWLRKKWVRVLVGIIVVVNIEGLFSKTLKPATGEFPVAEAISRFEDLDRMMIVGGPTDDVMTFGGMILYFYRPDHYRFDAVSIQDYWAPESTWRDTAYYYESVLGSEAMDLRFIQSCKVAYQNGSSWIARTFGTDSWIARALRRTAIRTVYDCRGTSGA